MKKMFHSLIYCFILPVIALKTDPIPFRNPRFGLLMYLTESENCFILVTARDFD